MNRWMTRDEFLSCMFDDEVKFCATVDLEGSGELHILTLTRPAWTGLLVSPNDRIRADFTVWP